MTAILSAVYPNSVQLLTDGANYTEYGVVAQALCKVHTSPRIPFAVTGRGAAAAIDLIANDIVRAGECGSVDETLEYAAGALDATTGSSFGFGNFDIVLAGWSETRGPFHALYATHERYARDMGVPPHRLFIPNMDNFVLGPQVSALEMVEAGINLNDMVLAGEDAWRRFGADMMEVLRQKPGVHWDAGDVEMFGVGCHVDLTVITKDGVETTRLREWDDPVGQPIDPKRNENKEVANA